MVRKLKTELLILGAGGHGRMIADSALESGNWSGVRFLDDRQTSGTANVIGTCADLPALKDSYTDVAIAIGDSSTRLSYYQQAKDLGFRTPVIRHPGSIVSKNASIEDGTFIAPAAVINTHVNIGCACIINTNSNIDHDCQLGVAVSISPGANIAGGVTIGDRTWIGIGATIIEQLSIGPDSYVAAGAVVIRSIRGQVRVAGVPAKNMRDSGND